MRRPAALASLPAGSRCATEAAFAEAVRGTAVAGGAGRGRGAVPGRSRGSSRRRAPALPAGLGRAMQRFRLAAHGRHARDARRGGHVRSVLARSRGALGPLKSGPHACSTASNRPSGGRRRRRPRGGPACLTRPVGCRPRMQSAPPSVTALRRRGYGQPPLPVLRRRHAARTPRRAGRCGLRRRCARRPLRDVAVPLHLSASRPGRFYVCARPRWHGARPEPRRAWLCTGILRAACTRDVPRRACDGCAGLGLQHRRRLGAAGPHCRSAPRPVVL